MLPLKRAVEMSDEIKTINELANRRQYFRIEDKASIEIAALPDNHTAAEFFDLNPEFGLISEFQLLDVESKHLLRSITDKDKNLGQFLRVLNKKVDSLSRIIASSHQITPNESIQDINLSEGGIAIHSMDSYKPGQKLAIKLILFPSYSGLLLEGEVLSYNKENSPYELNIMFSDISEAHQQLIARHIMRIQSQKMQPKKR